MSILGDELTNDPLGRGYAGMTDKEAVADINSIYRDNWIPISSSQIFETIDATEFMALGPGDIERVDRILGLGADIQTVPGSQSRAEMISVFGGGSNTIANLATLANQQISRGADLKIGLVKGFGIVDKAEIDVFLFLFLFSETLLLF